MMKRLIRNKERQIISTLEFEWLALTVNYANTSRDHVDYMLLKSYMDAKGEAEPTKAKFKDLLASHFQPKAKHNLAYPAQWTNKGVRGQSAYGALRKCLETLIEEVILVDTVADARPLHADRSSLFMTMVYNEAAPMDASGVAENLLPIIEDALVHFDKAGCFEPDQKMSATP